MDVGKAAGPSGVRKGKKKQVKDEVDRMKQAEKKKRRLEKALATSAAIISELEKKKQKKKEEQERLDEEGAAIAEAVALQVLMGEDSDDRCSQVMMEESGSWDSCGSNFDLFVDGGGAAIFPHLSYGQQVYNYRSQNEEFSLIFNAQGGSRNEDDGDGDGDDDDGAFGLMAARAVSALQIADDEDMNAFVFNRMVRG